MTDNYEYLESITEQTLDDNTVFKNRQINYIVDINNAVYATNGTCLVQFNLQNLYNSDSYYSNELNLLIPISMCYKIKTSADNATFTDLTLKNDKDMWHSLMSLKNNGVHLVHSVELISNDNTVEQLMPYVNIANHFQMLSRYSQDDLRQYGRSYGLYDLDNDKSLVYNNVTKTFYNNIPYVDISDVTISSGKNKKNFSECNNSLRDRQSKYNVGNGFDYNNFDLLYNNDKDIKTYKPRVEIIDSKFVRYTDYVVIPLKNILGSIEKMPLCKRLNLKLNVYLNVGSSLCNLTVAADKAAGDIATIVQDNNFVLDKSSVTFNNTCPYMINNNRFIQTSGTNRFLKIYSALFVGTPQDINVAGELCNFKSGGGSAHPLPNCRIYYQQFQLRADKAEEYMTKHINKNICFRTYLQNEDRNVGPGSYAKLISPGIKNPLGLLIFVTLSKGLANISQYQNPLDSCPSTSGPFQLINLQVVLGGTNVLNQVKDYNFDNFLNEVAGVDKIMSSDWGITNGLLSQKYWEDAYHVYYIDLSRCERSNRKLLRSLEVQFNNNINDNFSIDLLYFTFYEKEMNLNTQLGIWTEN